MMSHINGFFLNCTNGTKLRKASLIIRNSEAVAKERNKGKAWQ